jgi:hypothetical protein
MIAIKEKCQNEPQIRPLREKLEECTKRVNAHPGTIENCQEELFDFIRAVDNCVNKLLI